MSVYEFQEDHGDTSRHASRSAIHDRRSVESITDFATRDDSLTPRVVNTLSLGGTELHSSATGATHSTAAKDFTYKIPLSTLASEAPIALLAIDCHGRILTANTACKSVIGIPASCLIDTVFLNYLKPESADKLSDLIYYWQPSIATEELVLDFSELAFEQPSLTAHIRASSDSSNTAYYISLAAVSRQRKIAEQLRIARDYLEKLATHDALTGLPNRINFIDTLRSAMLNSRKTKRQLALFFFDLDGFKEINDQRGHHAGDVLLCEIANRLRVRIRDVGRLARLGGDEFTLLIEHNGDNNSLSHEAEKILGIISEPVTIAQYSVKVTASIGIAVFPQFAKTPTQLIQYADSAMYESKALGGNTITVFSDKQHNALQRKIALEKGIKTGIDKSEFYLNYQPIIDTSSKQIVSVEVLTRWEHPVYGSISPEEFIPIAERTGQINELGVWILDNAFDTCRRLIKLGKLTRFAINISPLQLSDPNLSTSVMTKLAEYRIPPEMLELEITESCLINDIENARKIAEEFYQHGCTLSIDDFGTGHSSLARLTELPVKRLKLDRLFITDLEYNDQSKAIVEGVVHIAHNLGMEVVAEGVEDQYQINILEQFGCSCLQGFGIGRPGDASSLAELLSDSPILN